jgi:oxygen-independent coproporphyrinogen-3 oxidase
MIGLKNQTLDDIDKSIQVAAKFGASHISMYALTPEDGTPIYTDYLNGELPDSDEVAEMYAFGYKKLKELGFERYEVSNFCKKGKESKHNLNYWHRGEYIGFGVSASSCIKDVRFTNTFDLDEYFKCILSNHFPVVDSEKIDENGQRDEFIMLALRTAAGLDLTEFEKRFKLDFKTTYATALQKNANYLDVLDGRICIKPEYLFVQNSIIVDFLEN